MMHLQSFSFSLQTNFPDTRLSNSLFWNANAEARLQWELADSSAQLRLNLCRKIPPLLVPLLLKSGQKIYKQRRRTPLLFLTGKSPEVIFPLPWNKSMKHNSLWTIAHLLKSDVGRGASHHRAYSVCWQRRPLINKARSLKQVPEHEFSSARQFRKKKMGGGRVWGRG